ncbi:MAG: hypothetical protein V1775_08630 [Bacteroidota bacterium]
MEKTAIIEKFGGLLKEEPLSCVNDESLVPDTCVLEAVNPFLGYYCEVSNQVKPSYFYMMLEGHYSIEQITRATISIRNKFNFGFDAVPGYIHVFDQYHRTVRLRNLEQFGHIGLLQKFYRDAGFALHKKVKTFINQSARISLSKLFYLEPAGELMFFDRSQPHHGYFIIPRQIEWDEFSVLTKEVKYETSLLNFDAATAYLYENQGITDIVRIYRENLTLEKLSAIRNRYLKLMK